MTGEGVFTATVGIGHGIFEATIGGTAPNPFAEDGRCICGSAGESAGVDDEWVGEDIECIPTGLDMVDIVGVGKVDETDCGVCCGGCDAACMGGPSPPPSSRLRFVPRVELSFNPRAVALMRI